MIEMVIFFLVSFEWIRQLLNSPLLARRLGRRKCASSSDDDDHTSDGEILGNISRQYTDEPRQPGVTTTAHNYQDLESFQKAQLLNKVSIVLLPLLLSAELDGTVIKRWFVDQLRQTLIAEKQAAATNGHQSLRLRRREFVLNNKAPLWNEHSQVYQLDFGGRVTQESAKNFQIEFKGKQVRVRTIWTTSPVSNIWSLWTFAGDAVRKNRWQCVHVRFPVSIFGGPGIRVRFGQCYAAPQVIHPVQAKPSRN